MKNTIARLAGALLALMLTTSLAAAQSKVTIAVGGTIEQRDRIEKHRRSGPAIGLSAQ